MADEPKTEDPEIPAEPEHAVDTDPRVDERGESPDEEVPAEVIDDDRFQATDN